VSIQNSDDEHIDRAPIFLVQMFLAKEAVLVGWGLFVQNARKRSGPRWLGFVFFGFLKKKFLVPGYIIVSDRF